MNFLSVDDLNVFDFFCLTLKIQLLLMKRGGQVIYGGKLGTHSQVLVDYFQVLVLIFFSSALIFAHTCAPR